MYKMSEENTPGVGRVLEQSKLPYIPEAHCYLKIDGKRVDVTSLQAIVSKVEKVLLEEQEIMPEGFGEYKVTYHKNFIKNWIGEEWPGLRFEEVWLIRGIVSQLWQNN
jgi:hypothetical protein